MSTIITSIDSRSAAEKGGVKLGEKLIAINGHEVVDVLDYRFYGYDKNPELTLAELAEMFAPPVTKSCLNHRLRKLTDLAKE